MRELDNSNSNNNNKDLRQCNVCQKWKRDDFHQTSDYYWICDACYQERINRDRIRHTNWETKPTIDSLDEAMYYFNYLQKDRPFKSFTRELSIIGDKGPICYVCHMIVEGLDPFKLYWKRNFAYYVCYNREYLAGHAAANFFERAPASFKILKWQTVHSKIIDHAMGRLNDCNGVRIVIVMLSKKVWYIDPIVIKDFAFEYETEHILPRETLPECSIPVIKLEEEDPFLGK